MKRRIIVILCVCLALSVTACSRRDDTKEPAISRSLSISENPSTPSEQESKSELTVSSDVGEPLVQDNTDDDDTEQPESQRSQPSSSASSSPPTIKTVIEPDTTTVYIELSSNTITLDQIDNSFQVPYKIHNNSSKNVNTGPDYVIEKYNGSDWSAFPFSELEQPNWPSVIIPIPKNSAMDGNLTYWDFEDDMLPGTYRLVKHVSEEGKDYLTLYAKFSVVE